MENYLLDTGKRYIKDIYAPECFYRVPEYQRPYVWGKEQIDTLLEDLTAAYENSKEKEYFIGSMIWNTKKISQGEMSYNSQDILDGQQRFITFYLLHAVIRDITHNQTLKNKVGMRLIQEEDQFDGIPERNRIEFEIRDDSEFLDKFLIPEGATTNIEEMKAHARNVDSKSITNMANAIENMHLWWNSFKETQPDETSFQKYLSGFFTYISNKVLALYLATPNNLDDAYNLFTVLNSRGMQLQVSDILRAQNLRCIEHKNTRKRYAQKWSDFENTISTPYKSFDEFLWAMVFIKMKYRSDDNESLKKAFDFMYQKGMLEKGKSAFEFIEKYVGHYEAIISGSIQPAGTQNVFPNLVFILSSVFGSQFLAPLMHYRECFGEHMIVDFLIKLDNLLSASWLVGKRTLQTRIFIILRKMEEFAKKADSLSEKCELAEDFLESEVLRYDYDDEVATTRMDIEEFYSLLDQEEWGSFSGTRINKTRYILLKLDLLKSNLGTQLQFNRKSSSVEHLMPRSIDNTEWKIDTEQHQTWVHRLGNIVLIDRKKNSSLSNRLYPEKIAKYKTSIETRPHTNWLFLSNTSWEIPTIEKNHEHVVSLLKEYYEGNSIKTLMKICHP